MKCSCFVSIIVYFFVIFGLVLLYSIFGFIHWVVLIITVIVWICSCFIGIYAFKRKKNIVGAINFFTLYAILIIGNIGYDRFLDHELSQFDLDKDSVFSKEEQTDEQKEVMQLVTNDLSRSLLVFTGLIISAISSSLLYFFLAFLEKNGKLKFP